MLKKGWEGRMAGHRRRPQSADCTTVTILRADDGSVGLRFLRPQGETSGPLLVTSLVPKSAVERSGNVKVGDWFCAVDGHDVSTMDDATVAGHLRGAPSAAFTLSLCAAPPRVSLNKRVASQPQRPRAQPAVEGEKEVALGMEWAARSGRLAAQNMQEFRELLQLLSGVSLPHSQVVPFLLVVLQHTSPCTRAQHCLHPTDWQQLYTALARGGDRAGRQWQRVHGRAQR